MRPIVAIHLLLIVCLSCRQTDTRIKRLIEMKTNGDTVKIQEFDLNGNLVFWKHFPAEHNITQVLAYEYENNKLTNYTWAHSNVGFIISEYSYDPFLNQRLTYQYESEDKSEMNLKLWSIYNIEQLRNTDQYKEIRNDKNRFLKEISIFNDTLLTKEIRFNQAGDTTSIATYEYENGLMTKEIRIDRNLLTILTHTYDTLGNELGWLKIYAPADTSVQYRKEYNGRLLTMEILISGHEKTTTQFFYNGDLLSREITSNNAGEVIREITYTYDDKRRVSRKMDNYLLLSELDEFTYVYETF